MATFVVLAGFTDQGIRNVKKRRSAGQRPSRRWPRRAALPSRICIGCLAHTTSLRFARHRMMRDEAATALSLSVCSRGNVRSQTLRAFSFDEMKKILGKMI